MRNGIQVRPLKYQFSTEMAILAPSTPASCTRVKRNSAFLTRNELQRLDL